jgi:hypothetical protein
MPARLGSYLREITQFFWLYDNKKRFSTMIEYRIRIIKLSVCMWPLQGY